MGWFVVFGIIGVTWLAIFVRQASKTSWAGHLVCGTAAIFFGLIWWNGGRDERERDAAIAWAKSADGMARLEGLDVGSPTGAPERSPPPPRSDEGPPVIHLTNEDACTYRGMAYFREIGSWPTLSDGRDAAREARERCQRTTNAFP